LSLIAASGRVAKCGAFRYIGAMTSKRNLCRLIALIALIASAARHADRAHTRIDANLAALAATEAQLDALERSKRRGVV
jgi:predicted exporter